MRTKDKAFLIFFLVVLIVSTIAAYIMFGASQAKWVPISLVIFFVLIWYMTTPEFRERERIKSEAREREEAISREEYIKEQARERARRDVREEERRYANPPSLSNFVFGKPSGRRKRRDWL